jgi:tetratricopeptide (TPR) repeat protein
VCLSTAAASRGPRALCLLAAVALTAGCSPERRASAGITELRFTEGRLHDEQAHSEGCWERGVDSTDEGCRRSRRRLLDILIAEGRARSLPAVLKAGLELQAGRPSIALLDLDDGAVGDERGLLVAGVAYLERARREDRPLDLLRALDSLSRATLAAPRSPAAWFDLGIAAGRLHLCGLAEHGFRKSIALEKDDGWRSEAGSRLASTACTPGPGREPITSEAERRTWRELEIDALYEQGRLDEIVRRVDATVRAGGGDEALRGRLWWMRGTAEMGLGRLGDALVSFQSALDLFEQASDAARQGAVYSLLASASSAAGDWEGSWRHRRAALELLQRVGWRDRLDVALNAVAYEAYEEGLYAAAAAVLDEIATHASGDDATQRATNALYLARARAALGDGRRAERLLALHAPSRAASEPPEGAVQAGLLLIREAEALRWLGRTGEAVAAASAAIARLEPRGETLLLVDALAERASGRLQLGDLAAAAVDLATARELLRRERASLAPLQRPGFLDASAALSDLAIEVELGRGRADAALARVEDAAGSTLRELRSSADARPVRPVDEIAGPPDGVVVLRYAVLDDELLVWRITGHGSTLERRAMRKESLRRLALDTADALRREDSAGDGARRLGEVLLGTFGGRPPKHLVVVPDDVLFAVPFAALPVPGLRGRLIDHSEVRVAPTLSSAWLRPDAVGEPTRLDTFWVADPPVAGMPRLRAAREAAAAGAAAYGSLGRATLLVDAQASPAAVLAGLRDASVVELDVHSKSTAAFLGSALYLAPEGGGDALTAAQIAALDLRGLRIAVLASCDSSNSRYRGSEGIGGLQWAFLAAGAEAVVATLWEIPDEDAARFTGELHRHLLAGRPLSMAMRLTALAAKGEGRPVWTAFVHYGGNPRLIMAPP